MLSILGLYGGVMASHFHVSSTLLITVLVWGLIDGTTVFIREWRRPDRRSTKMVLWLGVDQFLVMSIVAFLVLWALSIIGSFLTSISETSNGRSWLQVVLVAVIASLIARRIRRPNGMPI